MLAQPNLDFDALTDEEADEGSAPPDAVSHQQQPASAPQASTSSRSPSPAQPATAPAQGTTRRVLYVSGEEVSMYCES